MGEFSGLWELEERLMVRNHAYSSLYFATVGGTTACCVLIQKLSLVIWICDVLGLNLVCEESDVWEEVEVMEGMAVSVSDLYYVPEKQVIV